MLLLDNCPAHSHSESLKSEDGKIIVISLPKILYCVWSLLDANCNLLAYRRHHWISYTGLFTTPLVVVTISFLQ
jgi:hypothetical protein